jgi:aryl-alcohol dehydrogenase-like predicted oxidoreductase
MTLRPFGMTGIDVSPIGLGTWAIGGDEWGPSDDAVSIDVIREAIDQGVTLIDTADVYGAGHSEVLIARALTAADDVAIVSKVGWDIYSDGSTAGGSGTRYDDAYIDRAFAETRRRLRREVIDVYLLHDPTVDVLRDPAPLAKLRAIREAGGIRWLGVSIGSEEEALVAIERGIDVIELPFNLVRDWARHRVLPLCAERGIAVIAREPLERGLLTGKYREDATFPLGDHRAGKGAAWLASARPALAKLIAIARDRGVDPSQVALAYCLAQPGVSLAITGTRSREQLTSNLAAADVQLTEHELRRLQA